MFLLCDPQIVARQRRLKNLLIVTFRLIVTAHHLGADSHDETTFRWGKLILFVDFFDDQLFGFRRFVFCQSRRQRIQHFFRITVIGVCQESTIRRCQIEALCRAVFEIVTRTLAGDLAIKVTFRILLAALIPLINGNRDGFYFEEFYNGWICECRLTVDDTIVSRTAQRMPIHRPDKNRLFLASRDLLSIQD